MAAEEDDDQIGGPEGGKDRQWRELRRRADESPPNTFEVRGFRLAPSVQEQPCATLSEWRIYQIGKSGTSHLVGYCLEQDKWRRTTAITEFSLEDMTARTESGRKYALSGPPDHKQGRALGVWLAECQRTGIKSYRDVTDLLLMDVSRPDLRAWETNIARIRQHPDSIDPEAERRRAEIRRELEAHFAEHPEELDRLCAFLNPPNRKS
ncbi:MAG: hypothetical protein FKY71_15725 [Spiribacter salinus]|uniref:Uncharacterized protein n=1 Tax=Spiribacter salinus TaxID=1335746 RepID=A0A540VMV7_9GAMM|nr:MAG: hypothetical protein FKY71_15725 [Spiribacter salinus]